MNIWGENGYVQIDQEDRSDNFPTKIGGRKSITSACAMVAVAIATIVFSFLYFTSEDATLRTTSVIAYVRLSSGRYITSNKLGKVTTTEVPWLNGSRFEVLKARNEKYQLRSLASDGMLALDKATKVLKADEHQISKQLQLVSTDQSLNNFRSTVDLVEGTEFSLSLAISKSQVPLTFFIETVEHIKGVNIGSWLIPERWMYPKFFDGIDVFDSQLCGLVATVGINESETRMKAHLDTWFNETDFNILQTIGVKHIRIPIGFWNLVPNPYNKFVPANIPTSIHYIDWAMREARDRGMTVMLDLHGGPGSQNGWDHSGCGYNSPNGEGWRTEDSYNRSIAAIEVLASRYGNWSNLMGIELLNEPSADLERRYHDYLLNYYKKAYEVVRKYNSRILVVLCVLWEDYFPRWVDEMIEPEYYSVAIDWHSYGFDNENDFSHTYHLDRYKNTIRNNSRGHPVIIGEWSNFYHPTRPEDQSPIPNAAFLRDQLDAYNTAYGWYFWNFKVMSEGFAGWSMFEMVMMGYDFGLKNPPPSLY